MSTHSDPRDCPNCGVSEETELCLRIVNRDEDGVMDFIHCDLCEHYDAVGRPEDYNQGEQVDPADVPARARALMIEQDWEEEDIDAIESFVAGDKDGE